MQKREGRSFAPLPAPQLRPDFGRTGRKGAIRPTLPPPAPLPPLTSALSRRAALFGAVTVAGCTAATLPAKAGAGALSANDARLVALADAYLKLDATVDVLHSTAPGYDDLVAGFQPLENAMAETPADTMTGVLAKARACQLSVLRDCEEPVSLSVADDVWRLFGSGALS